MEDILASIRRIIAADHTGGSPRPGGLPFPRISQSAPPVAEPVFEHELSASPSAAAADRWAHEPAAELAVEAESPQDAPASTEAIVSESPVLPPIDLGYDPAPVHEPTLHQTESEPESEPTVAAIAEPVYELQSSDLAVSSAKPDALISTSAGAAVSSSFQALAETVLFRDPDTVERMVREALRPMLKTWLDDNLPSMVERLVRAEIERVARGGRSRS